MNQRKLIKFLVKNKTPNDVKVHAWAENHGYNVSKVEEAIYKIAAKHVREKRRK
jgi:hypothetical protein